MTPYRKICVFPVYVVVSDIFRKADSATVKVDVAAAAAVAVAAKMGAMAAPVAMKALPRVAAAAAEAAAAAAASTTQHSRSHCRRRCLCKLSASSSSSFSSHAFNPSSSSPSSSSSSWSSPGPGSNFTSGPGDNARFYSGGQWVPSSTHPPQATAGASSSSRTEAEAKPVVVLLGWLGAKQKHLRRYAEWYQAQGLEAVTFILPMRSVLNFGHGGGARAHIEELVTNLQHRAQKCPPILFHAFSNTGWLSYGAVLLALLMRADSGDDKQKSSVLDAIAGCVVDSAPSAQLDPKVWASGFATAILGKWKVPANVADEVEKQTGGEKESVKGGGGGGEEGGGDKGPSSLDSWLRAQQSRFTSLLEGFFARFLQHPPIKQQLEEVVKVLSHRQPRCPQLYIYSDADEVIPHSHVEEFMERQRLSGIPPVVLAAKLPLSPHVDHFRSHPAAYTATLTAFLDLCLRGDKQPMSLQHDGPVVVPDTNR
eukprot:jgi/Chlat1/1377/Chrsp119S01787